MAKIRLKRKEGKWLRFTISVNDVPEDLSTDVFSFVVKSSIDESTYIIEKTNASFNFDDAANGIVKVNLSVSDLDLEPGEYICELKTIFVSDTDEDKSPTWVLEIEKSAHN